MSSIALRLRALVGFVPVLVMLFALTLAGCGSSEESMEEWTEPDAAKTQTPPSMLEYRIDSLKTENGRVHEQLDAVSTENRKLTARVAELETQLTEAQSAAKSTAAVATAPANASSAYEAALEKFKAKDFEGAISGFRSLLDGNVEATLADNCQYWIGESYYGQKKYTEALKQFGVVLGLPRSSKKADAMMMSGNCQARLGNAAAAKEAYEKVVADFPTSPLVEKAKDKLAHMK